MKIRKSNNYLVYIIFFIIIIIYILISTIGKKSSENIVNYSNKIIDEIIVTSINEGIKKDILNNYPCDKLIEISYVNDEISSINYNMDMAYELLSEVKNSILNEINRQSSSKYFYDRNYLIYKIPFYEYKENYFINIVSPKIKVYIDLLNNINGSIKTKAYVYGINSLKVDFLLEFETTSKILNPFSKKDIKNRYEITIASKIIQGKIPEYYGNNYKNSSDIFNL